jgi:drug/metabolite transporter (DMT)-like permease
VRVERLPIYAAAGATLFFWATAFVGIRALGRDMAPGPLALGRLIVAAVILGIAVAVQRHRLPERRDVLRLAGAAMLWPGGYFIALNASEQHIDAGTASVLVKLSPIVVALVAARTLGEKRPTRLLVGCLTALGGVAIAGLAGHSDAVGVAYGVAAAGAYAAGVLVQKPAVARTSPLTATWVGTTAGTMVCLPFAPTLVRQVSSMPAGPLWWLLYLGVFPTAVAFTTWAYALKHMPAGRLSTTTYAIPPLTVILSWALIGETPTARAYVGGALCIGGVVLALHGGRPPELGARAIRYVHSRGGIRRRRSGRRELSARHGER